MACLPPTTAEPLLVIIDGGQVCHDAEAAIRLQVRRCAFDYPAQDGLSICAAVSEGEARVRAEDEGRVGGDGSKPPPAHRPVEVPYHEPSAGDLVQGSVEASEAERPRVEVDADDLFAIVGGEQGLDAAAREEVKVVTSCRSRRDYCESDAIPTEVHDRLFIELVIATHVVAVIGLP